MIKSHANILICNHITNISQLKLKEMYYSLILTSNGINNYKHSTLHHYF